MIFVDTADSAALTTCLALPGVGGLTTNPSIIARASGHEQLTTKAYRECVGRLLSSLPSLAPADTVRRIVMTQAAGSTKSIIPTAQEWQGQLASEHWALWIKLLPTWEHLECIGALRDLGIATLVTAVYHPRQAEVALTAGADGIAVYVGRLKTARPDWESRLAHITRVTSRHQKLLLLASFPDLELVDAALTYSADITLPPHLLMGLPEAELTAVAIRGFEARILDDLPGAQ